MGWVVRRGLGLGCKKGVGCYGLGAKEIESGAAEGKWGMVLGLGGRAGGGWGMGDGGYPGGVVGGGRWDLGGI